MHDGEFHKNDSSWCASNAVDGVVWTDEEVKHEAEEIADRDDDEEGHHCCCGLLEFKFARLVDPGPFVDIRDPTVKEN